MRDQEQLHELSAAIGGLQADVRNLREAVESELGAAQQHRDVSNRVISSLSDAVRVVAERLEKIEPVVNSYRDQSLRDEGADSYRKQASRRWAAIWATIAAIGSFALSTFFDVARLFGMRPPPHP